MHNINNDLGDFLVGATCVAIAVMMICGVI